MQRDISLVEIPGDCSYRAFQNLSGFAYITKDFIRFMADPFPHAVGGITHITAQWTTCLVVGVAVPPYRKTLRKGHTPGGKVTQCPREITRRLVRSIRPALPSRGWIIDDVDLHSL